MATEGWTELDLAVDGMSCGSCVRHVEQALRGVDGVGEVAVDLAGKRARVEFDPARATAEGLVRAVEEAGYPASMAARPAPAGPEALGGCGRGSCG